MGKRGKGGFKRGPARAGVLLITLLTVMAGFLYVPATPADASPLDDAVNGVLDKTGIKNLVGPVKTLVDDVAHGNLPVVGSLPNLLHDPNVVKGSQDVVKQLTQVAQILQKLSESGEPVFNLIEKIPGDFSVEFDLPNNLGRVWAKKGKNIALCLRVYGPNGSQAEFGVADDDPLGSGNAPQFANPGHKSYAFFDLTRNGKSYIHGRLPMGLGGLPTVTAEDYIHYGKQCIRVQVGAVTDNTVEAKFEVGMEAMFSDEVSVGAEAKAVLSVEVDLKEANSLLNGTTNTLANAVNQKARAGGKLEPKDVADVITAALKYMADYNKAHPGALKDVSLGTTIMGEVGVGVLDTVWPAVSATGGITLSTPAEAMINITSAVLQALLEAGVNMGDSFLKINALVLAGQMESDKARAEMARLEKSWNTQGKDAVNRIIKAVGHAVKDTSMNVSLSVDVGGYNQNPSADDKAQSTINVFRQSVTIPVGKLGAAFMDSDFLPDTVKGLSILLGQLTKGKIPQAVPPELGKLGDLADSMAEGTVMKVAMMTPVLVQVTWEAPAKPFFNWIKRNTQSAVRFIGALQKSADSGSLAALATGQLREDLKSLIDDLGKDMFLGLNLGVGANAEVGAVGVLSVGAGAAAHIKANPEMLLLLASGGIADLHYSDGRADMGFDLNLEGGAGVKLGEGVEAGASGGLGFSTSLLNVILTEWDGPVPQIYVPPASSNADLASLKVSVSPREVYMASPVKNDPGTYTVQVPNGTKVVMIEPRTVSGQSTFVFQGYGPMKNGAGISYVLKNTVEHVPFTVAAENGNWKGYVLEIQTMTSNDLASLELSASQLVPSFNKSCTDYTAIVPEFVASATIKAVAVDPLAKLSVQYVTKEAKQGELSEQVNLRYGPNKFVLSVTDQDGSTKNYNVTVNRFSSKLEKLTVSYNNVSKKITPSFDPDKYYYAVTVEPGKEIQVDVHAKPLDSTATVKIDGLPANEDNWYTVKVNLPGTTKTVPIEVTSDRIKSTYMLVLNGTSSDVSLKELSVGNGTLSPGFNPEITQYTATVGLLEKGIELSVTASDPGASLVIDGKPYPSSSATTTIPLNIGLPGLGPQSQILEVTVVAPDGSTRTYTVTVKRGFGR
ncbi:MAG: cadherin-like beta sandwich domain-containing protein [Peptococcaceae bacterium]|nr:cadherin-like beta sandwich domain-containing protein [Peptococcaceae bacterium]